MEAHSLPPRRAVQLNGDPHEFLDFIGGKLSRRFVAGEEDLSKRIEALDTAPDPDGRYRVNQFFCRPDTWHFSARRERPATRLWWLTEVPK